MSKMESSQSSSVPYTLSDIQLPQSPGEIGSQESNDDESSADIKSKLKSLKKKTKSNGVKPDAENPSSLSPECKKSKRKGPIKDKNETDKKIAVGVKEHKKLDSNDKHFEVHQSVSGKKTFHSSSSASEGSCDDKKSKHADSRPKKDTKQKKGDKYKSKDVSVSKIKNLSSESDNDARSSDSDSRSKKVDLKTKKPKLSSQKPNESDDEIKSLDSVKKLKEVISKVKGKKLKEGLKKTEESDTSSSNRNVCNSGDKKEKNSDSESESFSDRHKSRTESPKSNVSVNEKLPDSKRGESENSSNSEDSNSSYSDQESVGTSVKKVSPSRLKERQHSVSPLQHSSSSSRSDSSTYEKHKKSSKEKENDHCSDQIESDKSYQLLVKMSDKTITKAEKTTHKSDQSDPPKKRIKIKRDHLFPEVPPKSESTNKPSQESNVGVASSSGLQSKSVSVENEESLHDLPYVSRKVSISSRKNRQASEDTEPKPKKSKWGSYASKKPSESISISTDSLKNWFPDFKLISESAPIMEIESEDTNLPDDQPQKPDIEAENDTDSKAASTYTEVETESQEPIIEDLSEQGPVSKMIFIKNLVRPFTLNQLKTLLKQNGNFVEESFWIDKIKSKCFVTYETEKEALKARNALNNSRWPASNPKILSVEFSNEEELELHKKGGELPPKPPVVAVTESSEAAKAKVHSIEEKRRERERHRERERPKPHPPMREWDKDKIVQESPERESREREEKRSSEKKDKKDSKKKASDDSSAKLLDDLFLKTKSTPCIYWLPLTEEQVQQKEEAKKQRKLEREKRIEQMKQEESERRNRRARSPRRSREKENRKSSTRSRSPVSRRR